MEKQRYWNRLSCSSRFFQMFTRVPGLGPHQDLLLSDWSRSCMTIARNAKVSIPFIKDHKGILLFLRKKIPMQFLQTFIFSLSLYYNVKLRTGFNWRFLFRNPWRRRLLSSLMRQLGAGIFGGGNDCWLGDKRPADLGLKPIIAMWKTGHLKSQNIWQKSGPAPRPTVSHSWRDANADA